MAKILVADDAVMLRVLVSRSLVGHEIVQASDGDEALVLAREHRPEVVILDWMMPGLSGIEVCEAIRADPDLAATRLILMSARGDYDSQRRAIAAGVDGFVAKPVMPRQIADMVEAILATPGRASVAR